MKLKLSVWIGLVVVSSLVAGGCASSTGEKAPEKPTTVERSSTVTLTATVVAVDQATRVVTLRGPQGNTVTFTAGPEVRNLAQVAAGDEVRVAYYESLALRLLKPDEAAVNEGGAIASRAAAGEVPKGAAASQVTVTVTIEGIDKANGTVTIKLPDGSPRTVKAADPKNLEKIKVGDRVAITYTEALAVSIDKVKK
jgi:hypothetical protein